MFIGHFAVGFASKRVAPSASLGALFLAAEFPDLLWSWFLLLGIETVRIAPGITAFSPFDFFSYPYSHSLAAVLGWSVLFALAYWAVRRNVRESVLLGAVVSSHWVLDFASHRADLQLMPGWDLRVGLGLWHSVPATLAIEMLLYLVAVAVYARATRARDRVGRYGFWALVAFLLVAYLAAAFGPPPPGTGALAWGAQSVWLLVLWAFWVDRHRSAAPGKH